MKDLGKDNDALSWFKFPEGAIHSIPPPLEVPFTPLERVSIYFYLILRLTVLEISLIMSRMWMPFTPLPHHRDLLPVL
jgi:hypothetical protein